MDLWGKQSMKENQVYTYSDVSETYNMGLKSAIYVLEQAKELTPDGIHYVLKSLKKFLSEGEDDKSK
jgi:hypothetical protein